jgi:hypothetical protein
MSEDKELKAMGIILSAMEALEAEERKRVLSWLAQRLGVDARQVRPPALTPSTRSDAAGGEAFEYSTDTVATLLNARSGPDLIIAAAAHLHFVKGKQKFTRQDLTAEMRSAPAHFKETFVNNLSSYLTGLTKADRLRLVAAGTYALSSKDRQELEARLANAG